MALIEKAKLLAHLSPPVDHLLCSQLLDEFVSIERRFIQRDWEPAELDGGQFCEVLARVLYHMDSANLNQHKSLEECCAYIGNDQVAHAVQPRHAALHIVRVLKTVYKFRSQRGAVHISPTYTPNHMDAKLVIECVRWAMNETLRLFWSGSDRESVAKAIRELLQFDVPCVGKFEDVVLVQRTDLTAEEEVLVLLHYGGEAGLSRAEIGRYAHLGPPAVTRALQKLAGPSTRQIVELAGKRFRLTDLGSRRIREQLAPKLLLE